MGKLCFFPLLHSASSEHSRSVDSRWVWPRTSSELGSCIFISWSAALPRSPPLRSALITPRLLQGDKCDTFLGRTFLATYELATPFSPFLLSFSAFVTIGHTLILTNVFISLPVSVSECKLQKGRGLGSFMSLLYPVPSTKE